ncbi:M23 family metallopeptidase [Sphingomonas sp. XMGL2]|uniref:M23 family metallopeptidase n=2 Tax=Sphingomonas quercus TaxID=2842451 RepID=A0ABS6BLC4_9SPHN|nr:M23 family metallopeptidase [Sphingomonas quercus]
MLPQFHNGTAPAPARPLRARLDDFDLLVDLGADIGSRTWWRGFATCLGLCGAALSFAPGLPALEMPGGATLGEAQYQEMRADGIAPLAYGADTGRRAGATRAVEPLADTPERPSIDLTATLGRGDGFARTLERVGVSADEANAVVKMVSGAVALGQVKPGTRVELTLGRRPNKNVARPLDHLAFRAAFDMRLGIERENGALALRKMPIAVDNTPLRVQGRVGSSLYRAARAAGAPAGAVEAYIKALASRVSMNAIGADSRFDLIVAQRRAATGEVETGGILMAGLDRGKTTLRMMKWNDADGRESWFDATGTGETKGAMKMPVTGGHTTSSFGMRRHPLLKFSRMHKGMDIGAPMGAPIYAATDGLVKFAGWHGGHGNYVMIGHADGMATAYAHMSRIVARPGQHVRMGQVIGYVGSTGLSTGPHLHYEVYKGGVAINPATMKFQTTLRLAGGELARFKARLSGLLATRIGGGETKSAAKASAAEAAGD